MNQPNRPAGPRYTLRFLFLLMLLGGLVAFYFSKRPDGLVKESDHRVQCANNLKQLGVALKNYEADWGCLPPAVTRDASGRRMHSWRVLILPYLELPGLYEAYDINEPWDGPNNRKLHTAMPGFLCSLAPASSRETSYVAVLGTDTCWPGTGSRRLSEIPDGLANTVLLVETHHSGIHWMEPFDLLAGDAAAPSNPKTGEPLNPGNHPGGFHVLMADGTVHWIDADIPPATLRALLGVRDADPAAAEYLNRNFGPRRED